MRFILRSRRLGAAELCVTGLGAAAITLAAFPSVAQGAVAAVTSVSCSVTGSNWCVSGNNSSSGIGVIGTSKSGTGLRGTSTSQYGLKATSGSGTAILAQTTSGASAITATGTSNGYGVNATGFTALSGTSSSVGSGVYGTTSNGKGIGVEGVVNGTGLGVYGYSGAGTAVEAIAKTGPAIYAQNNNNNTPTMSVENDAQYGQAAQFSGFNGVFVTDTGATGFAFLASDLKGHSVFAVDDTGIVYSTGGFKTETQTRGGATINSFSPIATRPTVEDSGTATLVRGAAAVRLDPTFAAAIEAGTYQVFLTPGGDTHGLFVAVKTANGFVVRESQGGRSTVPFDYRILATAIGKVGQRMALVPADMLERRVHGAPRAATRPVPVPAPASGER